jgi:hypothetical protein
MWTSRREDGRYMNSTMLLLETCHYHHIAQSIGQPLLACLDQGVAVNDQKDVRTCNFGGKFFSRNDFFPGKTVKNENR